MINRSHWSYELPEKCEPEQHEAQIIIIGGHAQVSQKVVAVGLRDIGPIQVQGGKHKESPTHHSQINFPDEGLHTSQPKSENTRGKQRTFSSRQVQRAKGSKRCTFSYCGGGR